VAAHFGLAVAVKNFAFDIRVAISHFTEIVERKPENFFALTQLAILHYLNNQIGTAIRLLHRVFSLKNSYAPALTTMGEILRHIGRPEESIRYYERSLKINGQEIFVLKGLWQAYFETNDMQKALQSFQILTRKMTDLEEQ